MKSASLSSSRVLLCVLFCALLWLGCEAALAQDVAPAQGAVAAPVLQLQSGASATQFNVVVTDATPGAVLRYTTNGIDPTINDPIVTSGGTVTISGNVILKVEAWDGNSVPKLFPSPITTAVYNVYGKVATGDLDTLAMRFDGRIYSSGNNANGQLGDGTTTARLSPVPVVNSATANDVFKDAISIDGGQDNNGGAEHTVAAKSDGTVWAWGVNASGQLGNGSLTASNYPVQVINELGEPLTNAIMVSASTTSSYALTADGTVYGWGYNNYGELGDGTTTAWRTYAMPVKINATTNLSGIIAISSGDYHLLALKSDGTVWACGYNGYGQLGDGTTTSQSYAVQVKASSSTYLTNVIGIAGGQGGTVGNSMAVKADGSVWGWGYNGYGELGNGSVTASNYPVQAKANSTTNFSGAQSVSGGSHYFLILKNDGTLWGCGYNTSSQLGDGTTTNQPYPVQVRKNASTFLTNVVSMAGGFNHSAALDQNGNIYTWGAYVAYGALGTGTAASSTTNFATAYSPWPETAYAQTALNFTVSSASTADPTVFLLLATPTDPLNDFTSVDFFQGGTLLGTATSAPNGVWQLAVTGVSLSQSITAIAHSSSGLTSTVASASAQEAPPVLQLQQGSSANQFNVVVSEATPGAVIHYTTNGIDPTVTDPTVTVGGSVAISSNVIFKAKAWDGNAPATLNPSSVATEVCKIYGEVAAGDFHTVAMRFDGRIMAVGNNADGQLGNGTTTVNSTPNWVLNSSAPNDIFHSAVSVAGGRSGGNGYDHTVAAKNDGTVWAWGNNAYGELGNGTTTNSSYPVQVLKAAGQPLTNAIMVVTGRYSSYALLSDGTVWAWGYNAYSEMGDGTTTNHTYAAPVKLNATTSLSGVVAIAAGDIHFLALKNDKTLWACGYNGYGQLGDGTTTIQPYMVQAKANSSTYLSDVVSVAGSSNSTLLVKSDGSAWSWGYNIYGQLGNGNTTNQPYPVQMKVNSTTNFIGAQAVMAGFNHVLVLKNDGTLWTAGYNGYGQLGNGNTTSQQYLVQVQKSAGGNLGSVVSMAGGYNHSAALDSNGAVYTWGEDNYGQLGNGSTSSTTPSYATAYSQWTNQAYVQPGLNLAVNSASPADPTAFLLAATPTDPLSDIVSVDFYQGGTRLGTATSATNGMWRLTVTGASLSQSFTAIAHSSMGLASTVASAPVPEAAPVLQLQAGATAGQFNVVVTAVTPGAVIHYTTTGLDPTVSDATVASGGSVTISGNVIFKAAAWDGNTPAVLSPSAVTVAVYKIYGEVAAGGFHTLEMKFDGRILASGRNSDGQLGNGTTTASSTPNWVLNSLAPNDLFHGAVSVAGGHNGTVAPEHTVAAKTDGTVWAWGNNSYGELGNGTTTNSLLPVQVLKAAGQPLTKAVMVVAGAYSSYALLSDGTVWAWGYNTSGEMGDGTTTNHSYAAPVKINATTNLSGIIAVAAGEQHLLAVKNDGTLWACGSNVSGQLGDGTTTSRPYMAQVKANATTYLGNIVSVAGTAASSAAVKADGTVWSWGYNLYGQLGTGNTTSQSYPVQMEVNNTTPLTGARTIAGGYGHVLVLLNDGTVWAAGFSKYGQLGSGTVASLSYAVQVQQTGGTPLTNIVSVAGGLEQSVALDSSGTVYTWGRSSQGQLGNGSVSAIPINYATAYPQWPNTASAQTTLNLAVSSTSATDPSAFLLTATPTDPLSDIVSVDFYQGGTLLGTATSAANGVWKLSITGVALTQPITAIAHSSMGLASATASAVAQESTPVLLLQPGPSANQFSVLITDATPGAVIHYTTNGADPTVNDATIASGGKVTISSNVTLKAAAWDGGSPSVLTPSAVKTAVYNIYGKVAAGDFHTVVMKFDGRILTDGLNVEGQLGNGTTTSSSTPNWVLNSALPNDLFRGAVSVAAGQMGTNGYDQTVVAKSDGTVWAWGYNANGQLGNGTTTTSSLPVQVLKAAGQPLTNAVMVAAGNYSTYALLSDGTVWAWGYNGYGELGDGTTTNHSYAAPVKLDATNNLSGVVAIAAGQYHLLALKNDGTLWACGYNGYGALGDGTTTARSYMVQVKADATNYLTGVASVTGTQYSTTAVKTDGSVWSWGYNLYGELGTGNTTNQSYPVKTLINSTTQLTGAKSVAGGFGHILVIMNDGTLYGVGYNSYGQLGNGGSTAQYYAAPVKKDATTNLTNVVSVAGGYGHSVALDSTGTVYTWGHDTYGQLGNGAVTSPTVLYATAYSQWPSQPLPEIQLVLAATPTTTPGVYLLAVNPVDPSADGLVRVDFYQGTIYLGSATSDPWQITVPIQFNGGVIVAIGYDSAGIPTPLAAAPGTGGGMVAKPTLLLQPGTGGNQFNVVVSDTTPGAVIHYTTTGIDPTPSDLTVASGGSVLIGGNVIFKAKAWDGNNPATMMTSAVAVGVYNIYGKVTAGDASSFVMGFDGRILAVGNNIDGQLGNGTTTSNNTPGWVLNSATPNDVFGDAIALAGGKRDGQWQDATLAVRRDGTVWAWGGGDSNMLGNAASGFQLVYPEQVVDWNNEPLAGAVAVTTGFDSGYALKSDGTVWAWGNGSYGQLGNGTGLATNYAAPVMVDATTTLSGIVAIAAGDFHLLALKNDGTLWACGQNSSGQLGDGTTSNRYYAVQVMADSSHVLHDVANMAGSSSSSVAVTSDGSVWSWGDNSSGQFGDGTTNPSSYPVQMMLNGSADFSGAQSVAAGYGHFLILKNDGTLWATGSNSNGQLGCGISPISGTPPIYPVQVKLNASTNLTNIVSMAGGYDQSMALDSNGLVYTWGGNGIGQLGSGAMSSPAYADYATAFSQWPTRTNPPIQLSLTTTATGTPGVYTISVIPTDPTGDGLVRVDFYQGKTLLGSVTSGPWQITASILANGEGITAIGYDSAGIPTPTDYYQGIAPQVAISGGDEQTGPAGTFLPQPLQVKVTDSNGIAQADAPLILTVSNGGGGISLLSSGGTQARIATHTDSSGQAQVYFQIPTTPSGDCTITVQAGTATPVSFTEHPTSGSAPQVNLAVSPVSADAPAAPTLTATITSGTANQVVFYEGAQILSTVTSAPYSVALPNVTAGVHSYTAVATDTVTGATGQATVSFNATVAGQAMGQYRYVRGGNTPTSDLSFDTFVIALNQTTGVALASTGNSGFAADALPWFLSVANGTAYHIGVSGEYSNLSSTYPATAEFQNPVVAFGAVAGGTPLYTNQSYSFGFGSGGQSATNVNDLRIRVFAKSSFIAGATNVAPVATFTFTLPRQNTTDWTTFAQQGFTRTYTLTSGGVTYPLTTIFQYVPGQTSTAFGTNPNESSAPFILSHIDTSGGSPAYYYEIDYEGVAKVGALENGGQVANGQEVWIATTSPNTTPNQAKTSNSTGAYSLGYTLDFTQRPVQLSSFASQPQFRGQPLPSAYANLSEQELLNVNNPVTYQFADPSTAQNLTGLGNSPELEVHPALDKLVGDLGNNPMAIANYVLNNIHLADALNFDRNGNLTDSSINCGGVNRGALATFTEQQGNPIEQCALLIYLLRKAGVPCGYVFPANDSLQMLDERMSSILRMQLHNAVDPAGNPIIPQILPVNYPWVAAYVGGGQSGGTYSGGRWIHIFPWMKDTVVKEGYDLNPLMPGPGSGSPTANTMGYQSGAAWALNYLQLDPNIMSLSSQWDDPAHLFVPFVKAQLAAYHPSIHIDDVGITAYDRQNLYTSWSQFPQPWGLTGALSNANFEPSLAQLDKNDAALTPPVGTIFNTVTLTVQALGDGSADPTAVFSPGAVTFNALELHNRRLMIQQTGSAAPYTMTLSLAPLVYGSTLPPGNFSSSGDMTAKQILTNTSLPASDLVFYFNAVFNRNNNMPNGFSQPSGRWGQFLGIIDAFPSAGAANFFNSGDLLTISIDAGQVTQQMLDQHAQNYWAAQRDVANGAGAIVDPDDLMGEPIYLLGLSYHKACDDFQRQVLNLYKTTQVSFFRVGASKMAAARTTSGALPSGAITLKYPGFDMRSSQMVFAAYNSPHADTSGVPDPQDIAYLTGVGYSANEHAVINSFFQMTDSASTVHVLQVAQKAYLAHTGQAPVFVTSQNLAAAGSVSYTATVNGASESGPLTAWAGEEWLEIDHRLTANPYAWAYLTPGDVTCANGAYTGMGFLVNDGYGNIESLLAGNAQFGLSNGGEGQATPAPLTSSTSAASTLSESGGTYTWGIPSAGTTTFAITDSPSMLSMATTDAAVAAGTDILGNSALNKFVPLGITLGIFPPGTTTAPSTSAGKATMLQQEQSIGTWGNTRYNYKAKTIADPVEVMEGGFHVDEADLSMPGPLPIVLQRHYYSLNQANGEFGQGWTVNYEPYLVVTVSNPPVIYAAEMDGSVIAYTQKAGSTTTWAPQPAANTPGNDQPGNNPGLVNLQGGLTNPYNNVLTKSGNTYTLTGADGSVRTYVVNQYPIGTGPYQVTRSRPYLTTWKDAQGNALYFTIGSTATSNDYGMLNRVTSSNGNYIQLDYDGFGHIITALSSDGRKCSYGYDTYGDLTSVTRADGTGVGYVYDHQQETVAGKAQTFSDHLLTQENKPDGRQLVNVYNTYPDRRVHSQQATVGPNNALVTNATFAYSNTKNTDDTLSGTTTVTDAYGRVTTYHYAESEITEIDDPAPLTTKITQTWYQTTNGSGAYNRSLQQTVDKRGLITNYLYDANGNPKQVDAVGDLTGGGTSVTQTKTYTFNAQNLPTSITDTFTGNTISIAYASAISPYLPTQVTSSTSAGTVSQTAYNWGNAGSGAANGVLQSVIAAAGTSDAAETDYTYTEQGYVASETHKTGTSDPDVSYTYAYDAAGNLAQTTDSAGRSTYCGYDTMRRPTFEEAYDEAGNLLSFHYSFYNRNGELEWTQGPRVNPDDYTYRQYDGAGRLSQVLQYRSQAKADGSGVEQAGGSEAFATTSNQYDLFGDLVLTMDPNGNTVQMPQATAYDAIGRLLNRTYVDSSGGILATESFTYEAGDQVATHTNARGGRTQYFYNQRGQLKKQIEPDGVTIYERRYRLDGRLSEEDYPNGNRLYLAYDDFNRTVTKTLKDSSNNVLATTSQSFDRRGNGISTTDAENFTTTAAFDALGRVKVMTGPPAGNGSARQQVTHAYDAAGIWEASTNAAGESTITTFDALHRPVQTAVTSPAGQTVRKSAWSYSPDHQSVTEIDGSNTNVTTTFTDIQGHPVLTKKADNGFVLSKYDLDGNVIATTDELNRTTKFNYDGLNRVLKQTLPDTGEISFGYDLVNGIFTRTMPKTPNNLVSSSTFDTSFRKTGESLTQSGNTTRSYAYAYNTSGANVGRINTVTDPKGIVSTYGYDAFGRTNNVTAVDSVNQTGVTLNYSYDRRGLLLEVDQTYQNSLLSPPTSVVRSYDGYGALASENVYLNGTLKDTWQQTHDSSGRRSQLTELNYPTEPFTYGYQADGALTATAFKGNNFQYSYGSDGLLKTRTTPFSTQNITSRDIMGRITQETQTVNGTVVLDESNFGWRADSTQTGFTATRTGTGAVSETRAYSYDPHRGFLTSESFGVTGSTSATLAYQFDNNSPGGLGQRTNAALSGALSGNNDSTYGDFARLTQQNTSGSLSVAAGTTVSDPTYDATGQLTNHNPGTNNDVLTWDAFGRLVSVQRNPTGNGFLWTAVYDGFGRRLQTSQQTTSAGSLTGTPVITQSSYDPEVEFLELAVTVGTKREWLVHGSDINGGYGDLQGTGGVDAVVDESAGTATGVISDIYGHTEATVTGTTVNWNPVRSTGYGPAPGTTATPLDGLNDLSAYLAWHGKYIDGTGFYYLGARYYDPTSGTFLSCDPLGHDASMSLYDYCGGDPVNGLDPDGRVRSMMTPQAALNAYASKNREGMLLMQMLHPFKYALGPDGQYRNTGFNLFDPNNTMPQSSPEADVREADMVAMTIIQSNPIGNRIVTFLGYQAMLGDSYRALDATFDPLYMAVSSGDELFEGRGLSPGNLGRDLSVLERGVSGVQAALAATATVAGAVSFTSALELNSVAVKTGGAGGTGGQLVLHEDQVIMNNYQRYYKDAWKQTIARFNAGEITIPEGQSWRTVLGQYTDAAARARLKNYLRGAGIPEGPGTNVLVNRWLRDPSGSGAYRIPDVRLMRTRIILDGTIGNKTLSSPQVRDFKSFSGGDKVIIVKPTVGPGFGVGG